MTSHSDDILDSVGFRRAEVLPLLAAAGIHCDGSAAYMPSVPKREEWPAWKLRLSAADYLTDGEVAAALAGVDINDPGYLSDEERAEISHWQTIVARACRGGSMRSACCDVFGDGSPRAWEITLRDFAEWCASKNPPIPYPLPGNPCVTVPTTVGGLRDALMKCDKERAEWKAKAEGVAMAQQRCATLESEIDDLRKTSAAKADEVAKLRAERDDLKANALAGKSRTTALKVIGGMAISAYRMNIHADRLDKISEIVGDLERAGALVTEKTLREWIKEAAAVIDQPTKKT